MQPSDPIEHTSCLRRIEYCLLPVLLGAGAAFVLLVVASRPARPAYAATLNYPGCAATIQLCIDNASRGDTILISAGDYTESLTLSKAVSLTGALSNTTILHALANTRVLTVTGAAVDSSVVISGLTFTGGAVTATYSCPDACGGRIYISATAQPRLENLILTNNSAGFDGGGLYAAGAVTLVGSALRSNSAHRNGGGLYANDRAILTATALSSNNSDNTASAMYANGPVTLTDLLVVGNGCANGFLYNFFCLGGIYVANSATISGGLFVANRGGLAITGSLLLTGTQFLYNSLGGASVDGAARITGAVFQGNQCIPGGGYQCIGPAVGLDGPSTLQDSQFISNGVALSVRGAGGGRTATMTGDLLQGNSLGGVATNFSDLVVSGTQFVNNGGPGAAVNGSAVVTNAVFAGNTGGGLTAKNDLTIVHSAFLSNTFGGALGGPATVTDSLFQNNQCACGGGGLSAVAPFTVTNSQFLSNSASYSGGGASLGAVYGASSGLMINDLFQDNLCTNSTCYGGGLYTNSTLVMTDTQFLPINGQDIVCGF